MLGMECSQEDIETPMKLLDMNRLSLGSQYSNGEYELGKKSWTSPKHTLNRDRFIPQKVATNLYNLFNM